jgi:uncharacterized protein YndB with AHSA1/START domain/DNA-binding transcriptional ArsR family regulator
MAHRSTAGLDASFAALSDATRRGVLEQLRRADASITDLADKFQMTLTGMKKHVAVLERAGLVATEKIGRVRTCRLGSRGLDEEAAWIEQYRQAWEVRFKGLDELVEQLAMRAMSEGDNAPVHMSNLTTAERHSDRKLVVTRTIKGPARLVFEGWARPELFRRWWAPKSFGLTLISYEADVRTGGTYNLVMGHPSSEQPMSFFGKYIEVTPPSCIVWTNDEGDQDGAVTTVTFGERDGVTLVVLTDLYPSKEALDNAIASGSTSGWGEQLEQLNELVITLPAALGSQGE